MVNTKQYQALKAELDEQNVKLVAVSKTHNISTIKQVYDLGQRIFGENKAQEMSEKQPQLPEDIEWHFIGHLQRNKVKDIAPFVRMIHSVDRLKLANEIEKEARKEDRVIDCLIQVHIAEDETKFGIDPGEVASLVQSITNGDYNHLRICGLMGIATLTDDREQIHSEFQGLRQQFDELKQDYFSEAGYFKELSMGMTSDYDLAIEAGSTMVRVGSYIFGERDYGGQ